MGSLTSMVNFAEHFMSDLPTNPVVKKQKLARRRRLLLWTLGATVLLLLAVIISQQLWLWTVVPPDTASDTLVLYALSTLNFVAFVVFSFIFVRNLLKLRQERRELQLGSKIKTRLLVYFIAISFLPIIAMATFSYLFLNRSLEKWFGGLREDVVKEAREVQREAVEAQYRSFSETAALLGVILSKQSDAERQETLNQMVTRGQVSAAEIVDSDGKVIAQSRDNRSGEHQRFRNIALPGTTGKRRCGTESGRWRRI